MGFFPSPVMDPNRKDSDSSVLKFPQPFLNKGDSVPPDKNIQNEHFSKKEQNSQQEIHLNSWLSKGAWSVMEQGFFAFSNFLLVLLLARWLDPQDYGWFTVSYSIFLFLATIHTSLFTEPMLVFGDGRFYHQQSVYFKALLEDHGKFIFFSGVTFMIPGIFLKLRGDLGLNCMRCYPLHSYVMGITPNVLSSIRPQSCCTSRTHLFCFHHGWSFGTSALFPTHSKYCIWAACGIESIFFMLDIFKAGMFCSVPKRTLYTLRISNRSLGLWSLGSRNQCPHLVS